MIAYCFCRKVREHDISNSAYTCVCVCVHEKFSYEWESAVSTRQEDSESYVLIRVRVDGCFQLLDIDGAASGTEKLESYCSEIRREMIFFLYIWIELEISWKMCYVNTNPGPVLSGQLRSF